MATNNKCDLPKVRLKFKTTASDMTNDSVEIPRLSKYDASPSIFPQRLKMSKQMNEAFMRYRKLKKNNYIRQMANQRKNVSMTQCKKLEGASTKNKNTSFQNRLQIALESSFAKGFHESENEQSRKNKLFSIRPKDRQSKQLLSNNSNTFVIRPHTLSLKPKKINSHSMNLSDSPIDDPQKTLELQGVRCQYQTQDERRLRMLKLDSRTKKKLKATQKSSSFLIQAWKQDKIYRGASYYLRSHTDPYQF